MYYSISYDDGYIVTCTKIWEDGSLRSRPLRKFHEQGDAIFFKMTDCQKLNDLQVKSLVRQYDPNKQYKRLNDGRRFIEYAKYIEKYDQ